MLTGVDAPRDVVLRARDLGLPALAWTDVDNLAGLVDFLTAVREAAGESPELALHPIVGAEISAPERVGAGGRGASRGRLVALVRNAAGYRNLCKLVSTRQLGADPGDPRAELDGEIDPAERFDLVRAAIRHQEGLIYLVDDPRLLVQLAGRVETRWLFAAVTPAALAKGPPASPAPSRPRSRNTHLERALAREARLGPRGSAAAEPVHFDAPKTPPPAQSAPASELVRAARATGVAIVAAPDVHWALPMGADDHRVRIAIKHNALAHDLPESWLAEEPAHLLTFREACAWYADLGDVPGPWPATAASQPADGAPCAAAYAAAIADPGVPAALARTLLVASECRYQPPLGGVLFPEVELREGQTAYSELCERAFEGARARYQPLRPEVVRRLDAELAAIEKLGFAPYFLLVDQIAEFARREEIPFVGRGSAAASLVSYCMGFTDADPLRYRLPFERFLNPTRSDRPDIDLDFCWRRRDEVLAFVYEAFGRERTAMICTLNTFGLRSAFREVALAEGVPPAEIQRWSRYLPWHVPGGAAQPFAGSADDGLEAESRAPARNRSSPRTSSPGWVGARDGSGVGARDGPGAGAGAGDGAGAGGTEPAAWVEPRLPYALAANPVARALAETPECRGFPFDDARWQRVLRAAARLVDTPRHFGLHPGGVVVSPGPISDFVPCQRAAKGVVVTQFDKRAVEAIGLVKMDLLGNRALTTIDDCVRALASIGIAVLPERIPEDDALTARTLRAARTLACFQVESPGMRNLLLQTGARDMDDVIQAVALIRPGPASSGMKDAYVRRFRGLEPPLPPHPRLTELLWDTHGVMLYQEDVMQAAALVAGLELAEADLLRRALQKGQGASLAELEARFLASAVSAGVERAAALCTWQLIANFASFAFCKAHAVTYGRIAYRSVYLKTHYPAAYLAAFLASETGYYEARVYVEEARRLGVPILGPDVNQSGATFAVEWTSRPAQGAGAAESRPVGCIRVGLGQVKGLSERTRAAILAARARAPFLALPDFLERTGAHTDEVEALVQSGAFDSFDRTRPELLWRLHLVRRGTSRVPADLAHGLDRGQLAAARALPGERARRALAQARANTGGWARNGLGLGGAELAPGETGALFLEPETPGLVLPGLPDWDARTRALCEFECLGLTLGAHPTELFACAGEERAARAGTAELQPVNRTSCAALERFVGGRVTLRGWLAASRHVRTANGRTMRFLTLEDETGLAEVVLFPPVYQSDGHRLASRGPFLVTGVVEDQLGARTLHAERIW